MKIWISSLFMTSLIVLGLQHATQAQVIVRCPKGNFNNSLKFRCVPTQESTLDEVIVSDCNCDDPLNIYYPLALCHRTITFKADSLIIPDEISTFDYPYFDLDPLSLGNLYGADGKSLLYFLDPDGFVDPYLEKGDTLEAGIILPINTESKSVTLDVWVPFGESASFNLYIGLDDVRNVLNQYFTIPPGDACGLYAEECYEVSQTNYSNFTIGNGRSIFSFTPPKTGKVSKIELLNLTLNDQVTMDNLSGTLYHEFSFKTIEFFNGIQIGNDSIDIGFSDLSISNHNLLIDPTRTVDKDIYVPSERFAPLYNDVSDNINDGDIFDLRINSSFETANNNGFVDSVALRVCYNEYNSCGAYIEEFPLVKGIPDLGTLESIINISENYSNETIYMVSLYNLNIEHTYINDLKISLRAPDGTTAVLVDQICSLGDDLTLNFRDLADSIYSSIPCPPIDFLSSYRPLQNLSIFNGKQMNGDWTLIIEDKANADFGTLNSWSLDICTCPQFCDCPDSYSIAQNSDIKGSIHQNRTYQTDGIIESQEIISGDMRTVEYQSGSTITLTNPFEVKAGSTFIADKGGCPD